jgi:hypothetical protein
MNRDLTASLATLMLLLGLGCAGAHPGAAPVLPGASQTFPVETLQMTGDPANRINLVVLGDGYTQQDQDKLTRDAQAWLATFKGTSPYGNYAGYFNVKLVHVVSSEDGAENGMHGFGVQRDTALGASFQNASPAGQPPDYRLLVVDNARAQALAAAHAPECTKVLVLVNDSKYGGSGGAVSVFSANPESGLIALHEFGHSFGGLADEYACGDPSALPGALEAYPNVTTRRTLDQIKWSGWIQDGLPLPTPDTWSHAAHIGLFEGAYFHDRGVFRPRHACRMRSLQDTFCEVCGEAIVRSVYGRVALIDSAQPASPVQLDGKSPLTLSITHPSPQPNTLQVTWTVDGFPMTETGDSLSLPAGALKPGVHQASVRLVDATPLVRMGRERLEQVHTWTLTVGAGTPSASVVPPPREHLLLRIIRDGAGFRIVERRLVPLPQPAEPEGGASVWRIEALGPEGQRLFGQGLEDPGILRGEFQNPVDPRRTDGYRLGGTRPASFLLRMPVMEAHRLEVFERHRDGDWRRLGGAVLREEPAP